MRSHLIRRLALAAAALALLGAPGVVVAGPASDSSAGGHRALTVTLKTRASDLRVQLDRLLGEHAYLTTQVMRAAVAEGDDFAAAADAVEANTVELQGLIERVYGGDAATSFGRLWRDHIGHLVDYAVAIAEGDEAGKTAATQGLDSYTKEFSRFLASANPFLTEKGVADLLTDHITQLGQAGQYATGDFKASYVSMRAAYAHMYALGDVLASAIIRQFPEEFPGRDVARSPALDLRVKLDRLLGEHTFLSVEAMRSGVAGRPEMSAARSALDANSADLQAAIGTVYGAPAGEAFADLWNEHIDAYMAYITAVRAGDETGRSQAQDRLEAYGGAFGTFLHGASPSLSASGVEQLVGQHAGHLLHQVDAYADEDYGGAYRTGREGYSHVLAISDALAIAIAEQFPDIFPALPATDEPLPARRGGPELSLPLALLLIGGISLIGSALARRRQPVL